MSANAPITIVSGLPRSGTSLMMQMLAAGGIPPFTDRLRVADESNPRGYYELERVKQLKTDSAWLTDARGKAVKIIHLLLPELPLNAGHEYRVVFMRRDIGEVIASQRAMLARMGKTGAALDDTKLAALFEAQLSRVETWLREHSASVQFLDVPHHELVTNPGFLIDRIVEFLGLELDRTKMAEAVDPTLWRQRKSR
jgi:Sulfotransferase family